MRKVVLAIGISLDGYLARPDGAVDFLFDPPDLSVAEFFASVDTTMLGRKTLEAALRLGGTFDRSVANYVFSRTQQPGPRDGGFSFVNESPAALVARLRAAPGKDLWLMGGGELTRDFLAAGLVDEVHLGVVPVLLGAGIPAFPAGFPQQNFELLENERYSGGFLGLRYTRRQPNP